jgi:hypothetical protein
MYENSFFITDFFGANEAPIYIPDKVLLRPKTVFSSRLGKILKPVSTSGSHSNINNPSVVNNEEALSLFIAYEK